MKIKYRSGYAEGGFLDDGANEDPISGNEVPTGSLAEEVRDDIPAQLSEGEFVVPADVVRFIGLDKLMKMRDAAKAGLADMEEEGQIGGQPAPMMEEMPPEMDDDAEMDAIIDGMDADDFEGAAQGFAQGGSVQRYEEGGSVLPSYKTYTGAEFGVPSTISYVAYENAEGDRITIPTLRGKPLRPIPKGYFPVTESEEEEEVEDTVDTGDAAASPTDQGGDGARTKRYKESGQYAADVGRSNSIRSNRLDVLKASAKENMTKKQVDGMYSLLTPQARAVYDKRFRDPGMIDKYMSKGMTAVDLMFMAQKTADTINRNAGTTEPDSGFTVTGEPIDWSKAAKYMAAGLVMGPMGLSGAAKLDMTDEEKEEATSLLGAIGNALSGLDEDDKGFGVNGEVPDEVAPKVYDQAYWQNLGDDVDIDSERYRIEQETGLNAYGHKIYKEPGSRTVWDDIEEVKKNKRDAAAVHAKVAKEKKEAEAAEVAMQKEMDALRAEAEAKKVLAAKQAEDKIKAKAEADQRAADKAAALKAAADKKAADKKAADKKEEDRKKALYNAAILKAETDKRAKAKQDAIDRAAKVVVTTASSSGNNNNNNNNSGSTTGTSTKNITKSTSTGPRSRSGTSRGGRKGRGAAASNKSTSSSTSSSTSGGNPFGYKAKGGLITKADKPPIKKMRSDNTMGLASKKKSKERAQAKKGALAAKRT